MFELCKSQTLKLEVWMEGNVRDIPFMVHPSDADDLISGVADKRWQLGASKS
jgi:hypothetical protein